VSKRIKAISEKINSEKEYALDEALALVKENANTKFDETIEVVYNLNVDPKYQDQIVREMVAMPEGLGKPIRVAVIAKSDKHEAATKAGADLVGAEELVQAIKGGKIDFDVCVATPDMMSQVGQLGKVLGPKGLMPNPKLGTVTTDVGKAVENLKKGQVEMKADKFGIVHTGIAKASFSAAKIRNNVIALHTAVKQAKPTGSKGTYIKKVSICSTMSPALQLSLSTLT
jgi:large subunit ribosomal protein L1